MHYNKNTLRKIFFTISGSLIIGLFVYISVILYPYNKSHILEIVSKTGIFAPIVLTLLHSFQVIVAPIPGQVFPFLMGFLYGIYWGSLMAVAGNFLGSFTGFFLGRLGERRIFEIEKIKKFEKYRERINKKSVIWLTILFILPFPGLPKDLLCYFAGLIGVRKRDFLISLFLGRLPLEILWVLTGTGVFKFFLPE